MWSSWESCKGEGYDVTRSKGDREAYCFTKWDGYFGVEDLEYPRGASLHFSSGTEAFSFGHGYILAGAL